MLRDNRDAHRPRCRRRCFLPVARVVQGSEKFTLLPCCRTPAPSRRPGATSSRSAPWSSASASSAVPRVVADVALVFSWRSSGRRPGGAPPTALRYLEQVHAFHAALWGPRRHGRVVAPAPDRRVRGRRRPGALPGPRRARGGRRDHVAPRWSGPSSRLQRLRRRGRPGPERRVPRRLPRCSGIRVDEFRPLGAGQTLALFGRHPGAHLVGARRAARRRGGHDLRRGAPRGTPGRSPGTPSAPAVLVRLHRARGRRPRAALLRRVLSRPPGSPGPRGRARPRGRPSPDDAHEWVFCSTTPNREVAHSVAGHELVADRARRRRHRPRRRRHPDHPHRRIDGGRP